MSDQHNALQIGDRVRTEFGQIGTVALVTRLTIFVDFKLPEKDQSLKAYLESQLTKIEPTSGTNEKTT